MIRKTRSLHFLRIESTRDGLAPPVLERVRYGIGEMDARYGIELGRPIRFVSFFANPLVLANTHEVSNAKPLLSRIQQFNLVINMIELKFIPNAFGSDPDRPMFSRVVLL